MCSILNGFRDGSVKCTHSVLTQIQVTNVSEFSSQSFLFFSRVNTSHISVSVRKDIYVILVICRISRRHTKVPHVKYIFHTITCRASSVFGREKYRGTCRYTNKYSDLVVTRFCIFFAMMDRHITLRFRPK